MAQRFKLTDLGRSKETAAKFTKGQPALIYDVLYMQDTAAVTSQEIADMIGDKLVTRQDPVRVVGFYMSTWKKSGLVELSEGPVAQTPEASKGPDPAAESRDEHDDSIKPEDSDLVSDESLPTDPVTTTDQYGLLKNCNTLRDAVYYVVEHNLADPPVPGHIAQILTERWKTVTVKQANDTLRKLAGRGELVRLEDNRYTMPNA